MKPLSEELAEETWKEVAFFSPVQSHQEMVKLNERQPDLLAFIMEFIQDLNKDVKELGLYLFFVVYRMFEKGYGKKINKITAEEIIECYDANEKLMEGLEVAHDRFFDRIARIQISSQPYVIKYVVDALYEAPQEEIPINLNEEDIGFIFLLLKTVIDTVNKKTDE